MIGKNNRQFANYLYMRMVVGNIGVYNRRIIEYQAKHFHRDQGPLLSSVSASSSFLLVASGVSISILLRIFSSSTAAQTDDENNVSNSPEEKG
jgi:hypothetical protein